jgi:integrase/recombinase XerD
VSVLVRKWIAAAGVKSLPGDGISAHALRHTCAQDMIDRGADIREVQHALGHRSVMSTEIYLRRAPVGLRQAMEGRRYSA